MSVVFISPKKRQRVLFMIMAVVFLLIIVTVYSLVFLAKPAVTSIPVVNLSKASIDLSIFNSTQFKQLQTFTELNMQAGQTGRDNPFIPYYQITPTPTPTTTPTPNILTPIKTTK